MKRVACLPRRGETGLSLVRSFPMLLLQLLHAVAARRGDGLLPEFLTPKGQPSESPKGADESPKAPEDPRGQSSLSVTAHLQERDDQKWKAPAQCDGS